MHALLRNSKQLTSIVIISGIGRVMVLFKFNLHSLVIRFVYCANCRCLQKPFSEKYRTDLCTPDQVSHSGTPFVYNLDEKFVAVFSKLGKILVKLWNQKNPIWCIIIK